MVLGSRSRRASAQLALGRHILSYSEKRKLMADDHCSPDSKTHMGGLFPSAKLLKVEPYSTVTKNIFLSARSLTGLKMANACPCAGRRTPIRWSTAAASRGRELDQIPWVSNYINNTSFFLPIVHKAISK